MRAEDGRIDLLDRHLARLAASAGHVGIPLDVDRVRARLAATGGAGVEGVRLTVGEGGDVLVERWPLALAPFVSAWLDPEPLAEAGTWRCTYKTTDRDHYRRRHDRARHRGVDEALLVNDRGEVTEGTRTNVWAEADGRLWTPPLASGGLGGVMRAHLLDADPRAGVRRLTPADVRAADAVYLSNALRGLMRVEVVGAG